MNTRRDELDGKALFSAILRRWWIIGLVTMTCGVLTFVLVTRYIAPTYEAEVILFIGTEQNSIGGIVGSFTDLSTNNQLITDYTKIAATRLVVEEAINSLDANVSIKQFRNSMSVYTMGESRLFGVSYLSTNPEFAAAAANELAMQLTIAAAEIVTVKNIRVIDPAQVPILPVGPNRVLDAIVTSLLGMMITIAIIFFRFVLNNRVENEDDIVKLVNQPVIGAIPFFGRRKANQSALITINKANSFVTESYKMFRTNINYRNLEGNYSTLMVTSANAGEGKTTTIANLAITLARDGKSVLLIDTDLRRPRIHETFNIDNDQGLTNVLFEHAKFDEVVYNEPSTPGLSVLTSGILPPSPDELLGSEKYWSFIEWAKSRFDIILLDAPPVLLVSDAAILSQKIDGVVLVVAAHETKKQAVVNAIGTLEKVGANILGVTINKMNFGKTHRYYGEYYNTYNTKDEKKVKFFGAVNKK